HGGGGVIIILEGPDGVGKSALANQLSERLSMPVWKRVHNPLYGMTVESSQLLHESEFQMFQALNPDVIVDRWYPSEYIYNNAFGRDFDRKAIVDLDERVWRDLDVLPVLLYWPSDATIHEM